MPPSKAKNSSKLPTNTKALISLVNLVGVKLSAKSAGGQRLTHLDQSAPKTAGRQEEYRCFSEPEECTWCVAFFGKARPTLWRRLSTRICVSLETRSCFR